MRLRLHLPIVVAPVLASCSSDVESAALDHGPPELVLSTAEGFERVATLDRAVSWLAPLACRSELVPRPALGPRGLGVGLWSGNETARGTLDVRAQVHAADHQVLEVDGLPHLVGPPVLAAEVLGAGDEAASLARQDGNGVGGSWTLVPPAELHPNACLVLLANGAAELRIDAFQARLAPSTRSAVLIDVGSGPIEVEVLTGQIDHAFFAVARPLEADQWQLLEAHEADSIVARPSVGPARADGRARRALELVDQGDTPPADTLVPGELRCSWFAPPRVDGEGLTYTLWVRATLDRPGVHDTAAHEVSAASGAFPWSDIAVRAGLEHVHWEGPDEQLDIRPTMGPGLAWGDFDGDGWPDLYLVQGGGRAGSTPLPNRLFRNRGDGTFEDVTEQARVGDRGCGMGALFFDADGDHDLDLYVANYGPDALYENRGDGSFETHPLADGNGGLWSAGVAAADFDQDGDLDLYVTSYLDYDEEKIPPARDLGRYRREDPLEMLPFAFPGQRNVLLENRGGMQFVDIAEKLGVANPEGRGMQAVFWDFDRDGDQDLYIANDVSPNVLFRNDGQGGFEDISFSTGLDDPRGGMGLALGDLDTDGDEDLFLTNWQLEANALYLSQLESPFDSKHRRSSFHDATVHSGLARPSVGVTSWGAVLFDFECDADLDLFVANGYTSPDYESTGICVGQPNHLFENTGAGKFIDASADGGPDVALPLASRAAVGCDFDRDGDVDLAVTSNNGRMQLLRNDVERAGRWLGVRLRAADGNTFGIGSEVTVEFEGRVLRQSMRAGTSYLGGNAPELHFGLGRGDGAASVTVRWPSGRESRAAVAVDRLVELRAE